MRRNAKVEEAAPPEIDPRDEDHVTVKLQRRYVPRLAEPNEDGVFEPFLPGDEIDLPRSEARVICQGDFPIARPVI